MLIRATKNSPCKHRQSCNDFEMMQQISFPEEASCTMIALEILGLALLHMCELLVDCLKLHFTEAASDLEVSLEQVGVALTKMIAK